MTSDEQERDERQNRGDDTNQGHAYSTNKWFCGHHHRHHRHHFRTPNSLALTCAHLRSLALTSLHFNHHHHHSVTPSSFVAATSAFFSPSRCPTHTTPHHTRPDSAFAAKQRISRGSPGTNHYEQDIAQLASNEMPGDRCRRVATNGDEWRRMAKRSALCHGREEEEKEEEDAIALSRYWKHKGKRGSTRFGWLWIISA